MNDVERCLRILSQILDQVLELDEIPLDVARQSAIFYYRQLTEFWTGYAESEATSKNSYELMETVRRLSKEIRFQLSEIGAESVFSLEGGYSVCSRTRP